MKKIIRILITIFRVHSPSKYWMNRYDYYKDEEI